jgi:hypothetical protein
MRFRGITLGEMRYEKMNVQVSEDSDIQHPTSNEDFVLLDTHATNVGK